MSTGGHTNDCAVADFLIEVANSDQTTLMSLRFICEEAKTEDDNKNTKILMNNFINIIDTVGLLRYGRRWQNTPNTPNRKKMN